MLQSILLRDFVIVDEAEIDFEAGFCVLSGETGAGKSILIDALGLALGSRADAGLIRQGAQRADITARFTIGPELAAWLDQHELGGDPDLVQLRRIVDAQGRGKALINGHPATVALLREVGEQLLEIHGQHAAQSLMRPEGQRALLDGFAGLDAQMRSLRQAWLQLRDALERLSRAESGSREQQLERERLAWQLDEIARLAPQTGEWETLSDDQRRLANAAALIEAAGSAAASLQDDDGLSSQLHRVLSALRPLLASDASLAGAIEMLDSAAIQMDEAASELAAYAEHIDLDPQRLAETEQRVSALYSCARKLRLEPGSLPEELARLEHELAALDQAQDMDALRASLALAQTEYDQLAKQISIKRKSASRRLEKAVCDSIQSLGMAGGRLTIGFDAAEAGPGGIDRVEFMIAGHAGVEPRPIGRVASGGELSRVSLAIAVSAAQANPVPTLIFDEADAGVGGAVADAIGARMRILGQSRQVLCVTHLPQVAARAHHHYQVSKLTRNGVTLSRIERIDGDQRTEEIARMLGGAKITATTRKHARELLDTV